MVKRKELFIQSDEVNCSPMRSWWTQTQEHVENLASDIGHDVLHENLQTEMRLSQMNDQSKSELSVAGDATRWDKHGSGRKNDCWMEP
jgi:TorA maturation chaperone TorD